MFEVLEQGHCRKQELGRGRIKAHTQDREARRTGQGPSPGFPPFPVWFGMVAHSPLNPAQPTCYQEEGVFPSSRHAEPEPGMQPAAYVTLDLYNQFLALERAYVQPSVYRPAAS